VFLPGRIHPHQYPSRSTLLGLGLGVDFGVDAAIGCAGADAGEACVAAMVGWAAVPGPPFLLVNAGEIAELLLGSFDGPFCC
jgi:hypothetical protein